MGIVEFLGLEEERYWKVFEDNAELVYVYDTIDASYELYSIFDFYIELAFAPISAHLQSVNPFKSGPRLEKYLDEYELKLPL